MAHFPGKMYIHTIWHNFSRLIRAPSSPGWSPRDPIDLNQRTIANHTLLVIFTEMPQMCSQKIFLEEVKLIEGNYQSLSSLLGSTDLYPSHPTCCMRDHSENCHEDFVTKMANICGLVTDDWRMQAAVFFLMTEWDAGGEPQHLQSLKQQGHWPSHPSHSEHTCELLLRLSLCTLPGLHAGCSHHQKALFLVMLIDITACGNSAIFTFC